MQICVIKHFKTPISRFLCLLTITCFGGSSFAQQAPQISQYMLNTLEYNPAYAGMSGSLCASVLNRQQWVGMKEGIGADRTNISPSYSLLSVSTPVDLLKGGIGLNISSDKYGYFSDVNINLAYSYYMKTALGDLGIGLEGGMTNKVLDYSKLKPLDPNDPILSQAGTKVGGFYGNFSLGAYLKGNKNYFAGISLHQIITQNNINVHYKTERTLYLNGGYNIPVDAYPGLVLTPTALVKTDFKATQLDITCMGTLNKQFWAGLGYRIGDAVSIYGGLNIMGFSVGVAYDLTASSKIQSSSIGGGFELFGKYCFKIDKEKVNTTYKNARYL